VDAGEVIGGVFLLIVGVLCIVPLPLNGEFTWLLPDGPFATIAIVAAGFCIIFGVFLIVAGLRSKEKTPTREVVGGVFLLLSFLVCIACLAAEGGTWTTIALILGIGFLVIGLVLVDAWNFVKKAVSKYRNAK